MRGSHRPPCNRRGAIAILAAFLLVVVIVCLAFAIDVGYICVVRTEAQAAADSAALAGGHLLVNEGRLRGAFNAAYLNARNVAVEFAALNRVGLHNASLEATEDVQIGRLDDPTNQYTKLDRTDPAKFNALTVTVRATANWRGQSPLFFASFFNRRGFDTQATATVAFADRIVGFRTSAKNPNATTPLLPFTIQIVDWHNLLERGGDDDFAFNPETNSVTVGQDGVHELKLFPVSQGAGNLGTVDIGNGSNSAADLDRQIRYGVNANDLAVHGGSLELDHSTGTLTLNGDTGISAEMKDPLAAIIGQPRAIPLFRSLAGQGNTLNYEIVGFAGIRILDVQLTGADKHLIIQPAFVIDRTAISTTQPVESYFVVQPPLLVR